MKKKLLYISLNITDSSDGGGGFHRTLNILKFLQYKLDITILTSQNGKNIFKKNNIKNVNFIIIKKEGYISKFLKIKNFTTFDIFLSWIIYTLLFYKQYKKIDFSKYNKIYTDSDFFIDVIPGILIKKKYNNSLCGIIHHEIKLQTFPKKINLVLNFLILYLIQKISFKLISTYYNEIFLYNNEISKNICSKLRTNNKKLKCKFVCNGLDIKNLKKYTVQYNKFKYDGIFIGSGKNNKGIIDILYTWSNLVNKKNLNIKLAILGKLGINELNLINKLNIKKNIKYFNFVKDKKKYYKIICCSKIVICPSYDEGWGISIMEARYLNKIVLCYNLKVLKFLYKKEIFFAKYRNVHDLQKKIIFLLMNYKKFYLSNSFLNKYDWKNVAINDQKYLS